MLDMASAPVTATGKCRGSDIIAAVLSVCEVNRDEFMGAQRHAYICEARQIAFFFMRFNSRMTYTQIGRLTGGKDHSTVWHGVKKITESPGAFRERVEMVAARLRIPPPKEISLQ